MDIISSRRGIIWRNSVRNETSSVSRIWPQRGRELRAEMRLQMEKVGCCCLTSLSSPRVSLERTSKCLPYQCGIAVSLIWHFFQTYHVSFSLFVSVKLQFCPEKDASDPPISPCLYNVQFISHDSDSTDDDDDVMSQAADSGISLPVGSRDERRGRGSLE